MNQQNQDFETSMQRLEQIVRSMERGDVPLEESLSFSRKAQSWSAAAASFWRRLSCR